MSPPFLFQIEEIAESSDAIHHVDQRGNWIPSTEPGANYRTAGSSAPILWFCDGQQIYPIGTQLPSGSQLYRRVSVYYSGGYGFWILGEDAANLVQGNWQSWHPLRFDHSPTDYSSDLSYAGQYPTLRVQRSDQEWPSMLLPDIYHTTVRTEASQYGGLTGELTIFLALIAFSASRDHLQYVLPAVFADGAWRTHGYAAPRSHQRGVVVSVYTCPSSYANGSSAQDLEQYEHGAYGKYFS